jgi:hypothetical protein
MRIIVLIAHLEPDGLLLRKVIRRPKNWPGDRYPYGPIMIGSLIRLKGDDSILWRVVRIGQGRGKKSLREW